MAQRNGNGRRRFFIIPFTVLEFIKAIALKECLPNKFLILGLERQFNEVQLCLQISQQRSTLDCLAYKQQDSRLGLAIAQK
ncbi:hypothetical protein IQ238_15380 [Pleurocapsales cyanobacterium LEGE 06147]|nr:hypothetical protein [Pleurocapsales cyanobacterium LEGE 06147]